MGLTAMFGRHAGPFIFKVRTLLLAFLVALLIATSAAGQLPETETVKLHDLLNVPPSTSIVPSTSSLPGNSSLRVFIAVGSNQKIQNAFTRGINQWNKKDGLRYGVIEVVSHLSDADVILARYEVRLNPRPHSLDTFPPIVPTLSYLYLIARKPDKLEILWRKIIDGAAVVEEYADANYYENVGDILRRELFRRMKERNKTH